MQRYAGNLTWSDDMLDVNTRWIYAIYLKTIAQIKKHLREKNVLNYMSYKKLNIGFPANSKN